MSIDKIKFMNKLRNDVSFTIDNLIHIYKDVFLLKIFRYINLKYFNLQQSFEEQGVALKSFENISA